MMAAARPGAVPRFRSLAIGLMAAPSSLTKAFVRLYPIRIALVKFWLNVCVSSRPTMVRVVRLPKNSFCRASGTSKVASSYMTVTNALSRGEKRWSIRPVAKSSLSFRLGDAVKRPVSPAPSSAPLGSGQKSR